MQIQIVECICEKLECVLANLVLCYEAAIIAVPDSEKDEPTGEQAHKARGNLSRSQELEWMYPTWWRRRANCTFAASGVRVCDAEAR